MENRSHALMTGLFTISLLVAAVLFGIWFNRDRVKYDPYLIATTQSIPGLNPQASVRYRGLEVGKVDEIDFDPKLAGQILIHLSIDPATPITKTTYATLGYQGVTGIAYIQLDDDSTGSPALATSKQNPSRIPLQPGLFDQLEKRGTAILGQAEEVTKRLNTLLSATTRRRCWAHSAM
jgi:phospholipid/cholesterol/gamma-HCH transport system substrate-binding protein